MSERLRNGMREARRESGLSWERFARDVGFSPAYLRNVENGNRGVTADVAAAYDRVLRSGGRFARALAADGPSTAGWDEDGAALTVLAELVDGRRVDRRSFISAGVALSASAGHWEKALGRTRADHPAVAGGGPELLANIEHRLDHLRRVDDELGSGEVRKQAAGELSFAVTLLKTGRYTGASSTRLYRIASEAARQVAWCSFDQGRHGTAQRYFDASLRASAEAGDVIGGAYTLSFSAVQCYSTPGQADRAVALLDAARTAIRGQGTPRMEAMLAARTARALSKTGAKRAAGHQLHLAHAALDKGLRDHDPDFLYWVTYGEIEMIAGSSALDLDDPAEALRRFEASMRAYPGDEEFPRSHAIYLARAAEAHLALDDLDAAVATARRAASCLGSVDSVRSTSQLKSLCEKLAPHAAYRPVRDFLEEAW
ncbi:helix-turn-helix domain-containing protein [Kitasatospora sp. DSM 101779]|uniref:helix-turn-helix domain-containing protein n=1 Tax=Kitasatospora sp. DSM 101779 TaxID=2853165 RepID=UPI0021D9E3C8|nr:helix-turn-helix transcriptional regulator [Kitasatospora sp. DSM 101779]MCU7827281.1 helix-turn-helix transcriptional regulator [Kitasatospora sp. DSM 101779]